MKTILVFLAIISSVILWGCAPTLNQVAPDPILPEIDVVRVKEYSEEALKLSQETKMELNMVNTKVADLEKRMISISEDASSISRAKIEELSTKLTLLIEAVKTLQQKVETIENMPRRASDGKKQKAIYTFTPTDAATVLSSTEYNHYQAALAAYDRRNYTKALQIFRRLHKSFKHGEYKEKSLYWIGECYYAQGKYTEALQKFKLVSKQKENSKSDDAQLKVALSYIRLGKNETAINEFQKLIVMYPASEYVARAEKYIEELKVGN